jgi:hypothetical protein
MSLTAGTGWSCIHHYMSLTAARLPACVHSQAALNSDFGFGDMPEVDTQLSAAVVNVPGMTAGLSIDRAMDIFMQIWFGQFQAAKQVCIVMACPSVQVRIVIHNPRSRLFAGRDICPRQRTRCSNEVTV